MKHTHASLFSGIGGAELAASWMGWTNVFHCEIQEFQRKVLEYWFPNSISYEDITKTDFKEWRGQIDVLTGGFPCQPFSVAGKRKGAEDNRYLWGEMLRAIRQIQPTWVVGENVAGILSMVQPGEEVKVGSTTSLFEENDDIYQKEQEFVVETVCSDLEREGYSVQPFVIPACAVGAPHKRDRVWFVARRNVPTSPTDTMYEGILRRPGVNESEGKAQRLQERNEIQQPTEPSSLLRHAPDTFNTGAEGMRERQAEIPFSLAASHTISGGDTTQQAYQGSEEERRKDDGQQSQRRATPQWSDGLLQLPRHTADTLRPGLQEEGSELQTEGITRDVPQMGLAADTRGERRDEDHDDNGQPQGAPQEERCTEQSVGANCPQNWWRDFPTVSPVCRGNDGLPFRVADLTISFAKWRSKSIEALGNAWVPQVAFEIFKAIDNYEKIHKQ